MKKILAFVLSAMLCVMLCFGAFAAETVEIKMTIGENVGYVNGEAKALDAAPIIRGNRTMLPVRFVAENLSAAVAWDPTTSTAVLTTDSVTIEITIGASTAKVNGEDVALDAPAFIENNRTYLPVRFVAENLGATVAWDGATSTATITLGAASESDTDDYTMTYPDGFDYTSADLTQYVKLGQYKGLDIEAPTVSDEELSAYSAGILAYYGTYESVTGRTAQVGDMVEINFVGKVDGVAFDGGSAENYSLTIGEGLFIDGFEDGIVGMAIGETKNVNVVFPEDYTAELAGKPAVFEITLLTISEKVPPEYTEEFVKENIGWGSIAEFESAVRADLEYEANQSIVESLLETVVATSEIIEYPEGLVEDCVYQGIAYIKEMCAEYGMSYETVLSLSGYTAEEYEAELRAAAETSLKTELVVMALAQAEGLIPTKDECNAQILMMALNYGYTDIEELAAAFNMSYGYFKNVVTNTIALENVNAFLAENN